MSHIHEKIDFTVEVFIVYNNKVLLRKHDKYKFWLSIGGHIELDEDPIDAVVREAKEEVGLDIELCDTAKNPRFREEDYKELLPPVAVNRHRINNSHEHVTFSYFAKSRTDVLKLSTREVTESCKWFTFEELEDSTYNIKDHIKHCAKEALKKCN